MSLAINHHTMNGNPSAKTCSSSLDRGQGHLVRSLIAISSAPFVAQAVSLTALPPPIPPIIAGSSFSNHFLRNDILDPSDEATRIPSSMKSPSTMTALLLENLFWSRLRCSGAHSLSIHIPDP